MPGIKNAVALAGNITALAKALGVTQQAVSLWVKAGYVPVKRAHQINKKYGVPISTLVKPSIADLFEHTL